MVQWGILSTARINGSVLAGMAQSGVAECKAVASRDQARARRYADEHRIERGYGSYDELLADPDIEAVYISLPNSLHLPWTERALRAGKHVLCEKPLGRRATDVRAAYDLAQEQDRLLMEAFMFRHHPQIHRISELTRSGAIGELRLVRGAFSFPVTDGANVRLDAELDGGALMDVGCYCVSATRLLAGEPELVTGVQVPSDAGVDLAFAGTMRFAGGVLGQFDAGFTMAARNEIEVVGDRGSLFLDDPWHARVPTIELKREDGVKRIELERLDSYRLEIDNFSAAIRGETRPLLGREDAVAQAATIEALYAAAASGETVVLSGG